MVTRLSIFILAIGAASTSAQSASALDCKTSTKTAYVAELGGTGNSRAVTVTFRKRPTTAEATAIVKACMQTAIAQDSSHELLGTAWIGDDQFALARNKESLAYFPKDKAIRPFGLADALNGLKRK